MSPRPQQPPEQAEARRAAILSATLDEVVTRGPESVRMKDVAAGAEVSVGTVQYYFASRDELLVEAFSAHSRAVIAEIEQLGKPHGSPWEQLAASLSAVPTVDDYARRSLIWVELVATARRRESLQVSVSEVFARWHGLFLAIVDRGIADGSFRPLVEPGIVIDMIVAAIDGFDLATASQREGLVPEQMTRALTLVAAVLLDVAAPPWSVRD